MIAKRLLALAALAAGLSSPALAQTYNAQGSTNAAAPKTYTLISTTLLGASTSVFGTWDDTTQTGDTAIDCSASSSTALPSGTSLYIQQTMDTALTPIALAYSHLVATAGAQNRIAALITGRFARCVYVNGTTAQTGTFEFSQTTSSGIVPINVGAGTGGSGNILAQVSDALGNSPTIGTPNATGSVVGTGLQTNSQSFGYNGSTLEFLIEPTAVIPAVANITTATTTQLVALSGTKRILVSGGTLSVGSGMTLALEYGTGTACGTGTTIVSQTFQPGTYVLGSNVGAFLGAIAGNALCVVSTGTGTSGVTVDYAQF